MSCYKPPTGKAFLVGASYNGREPSHWNVWDKPYDEIIETLRERQRQTPPGGARYLVMEVTVCDSTVIASEVTVS